MKKRIIGTIGAVGLAALHAAADPACAGYMVVDLHNPSFLTTSIFDGNATQQVGIASNDNAGTTDRAALWSGTAGSFVNLHPTAYAQSIASGTTGTKQVGTVYRFDGIPHAATWTGTEASFVDLNPTFPVTGIALLSFGNAISGNQQVGMAEDINLLTHPLIWSGSAASYVDVSPAGTTYRGGELLGTNSVQQVGRAFLTAGGAHAGLWTGSAASFMDLGPAGYDDSIAFYTNGTQQVGSADPTGTGMPHAGVWSGTSGSFVDLHSTTLPGNYTFSEAYSNLGLDIVGYGDTSDGVEHALLWSGASHTVTDLNQFFPQGAGYTDAYATGFGANGTIYGTAKVNGQDHAVAWVVPEPTILPIASLLIPFLRRRRRHTSVSA